MSEAIGVIGSNGDLGRRMVNQLSAAGCEVVTYDITEKFGLNDKICVDPSISLSIGKQKDISSLGTIDKVFDATDIVHWCAPLGAISEIDTLSKDTLLILHDSVMYNSLRASDMLKLKPKSLGEIGIVHCLMNPDRKVFVANDANGSGSAMKHMIDIGLKPEILSIKEHDTIMANSQAVLALVSTAVHDLLKEYDSKGYLTASASELLVALDDRASRWTPETIHSILSNPELESLIERIKSIVSSNLD